MTENARRDLRLYAVIAELEATGGALELLDREWRLVWVSDDLKLLLREDDESQLGYGEHILERYPWASTPTTNCAPPGRSRHVRGDTRAWGRGVRRAGRAPAHLVAIDARACRRRAIPALAPG
jgi:hypothetical protein